MAEAAIRECKELWSYETFGDLGGGDRHPTLEGAVGGWNTEKKGRSLFNSGCVV
jgi:hypothetical protein